MLEEFKKFAIRGNAVDMAVGIVIGAAFGKIVTSMVNDIVMPPIGLLLGNIDFSSLVLILRKKTDSHAAVVIKYGMFINTIVDFLIVAFAIFLLVRQINKLFPKEQKAPTTKTCPECCSDINKKATRCPQCTASIE